MQFIYHITNSVAWKQAQQSGFYQGDTLATEGFIHCSTGEQVAQTANRFYQGQPGLLLLEIAPSKVTAKIKYEAAANDELFPHIYGPLNIEAVSQTFGFEPNAEGDFTLPTGVR